MHLTYFVADVADVAAFSRFVQTFFLKHVFFFKLNFNSKLPAKSATNSTTRATAGFARFQTCYKCCYKLLQTPLFLLQAPNPNRESWFVNHKPHRRLTIINNGVITAFKLSHAFL
jgi:hypothetical protein